MAEILLASGSFWPREGGAERQMRSVLLRAVRQGHSCAVVTQVLSDQPRLAVVDGVRVYRVGSRLLFGRYPRIAQVVFTGLVAWRVARERPRAIVTIQLGSASLAVAAVRALSGARHIVRLTGGGTAAHRSEPWVRRSTFLGRVVVRMVVRRHSTLAAPAQHLLKDFDEAFPRARGARQLVGNGVEPPIQRSIRSDHGRHGVVWYSRGGAERSMDAFVRIVDEAVDLPVVVIGKSEGLPSRLSVTKLGWVDQPCQILGQKRILLNTSLTEGMPNMVLQAISTGMVVVGPSNEGLKELKDRYPEHIYLTDISQPDRVAELLRELHKQHLPKPAVVLSADEAAEQWLNVLIGA